MGRIFSMLLPEASRVNAPSDQNRPWPMDSGATRRSHSGKGGLLSSMIISPSPPKVSNPVSTIHTSSDHGDVTSTHSFPSGKPLSAVPKVKPLAKVAGAQEFKVRK